MAIDILKVRQDTPAAESVLHFNSAGSSLMPLAVSEATIGYLKREVEIGGYEAASERHDELIGMYSAIARLLSCNADEIAFCESATRAWDSAIYSLEWKDGDRILSASSEYGSNYITFLHLQKKFGVKIDIIPDDENGRVSSEALLNMMGDDVKLVSVTHVPATSGLINPVAEIGSVLKSSSALYVVDATQSAGQIPLDVVEIGCDILVGTGRKYLRAPRGTGFLYMRKEVLRQTEPVFLDNRAAELLSRDRYRIHESGRRFEAFEYNFAGKVGLAAAVDYALSLGLSEISDRIFNLALLIRENLSKMKKVRLLDPPGDLCGIVSLIVEGEASESLCAQLRAQGVNICAMELNDAPISFSSLGQPNFLRVSPHYFNTEDEIIKFCEALAAQI